MAYVGEHTINVSKELKMALLIAGYEKQDDDGIITYINGPEKITINSGLILHEDHADPRLLVSRGKAPSESVCRLFNSYHDLQLFLEGTIV